MDWMTLAWMLFAVVVFGIVTFALLFLTVFRYIRKNWDQIQERSKR